MWLVPGSNLSPATIFPSFYSVSPWKCPDGTSNSELIAFFYITSHPLPTNNPEIRRYVTWVTCHYRGKKIKCTLVHSLRLCIGRTVYRGSRGIALPFLEHGTRRRWGVSFTPRRSLPSGKTPYPLYRMLGGPQGRSGQVRKISPPPGFDPRTVQP